MLSLRFRSLISTQNRGAVFLLTFMLICVNSAVFFGNPTLLPITSSPGVGPRPYGYEGPLPNWTTTVDPWGSFNVAYAYDAYVTWALGRGILPFWNPYQGLGQPFLANDLSSILYPPHLLHLLLPPAWWDAVYLLDWFLAAVFLYAYLRLMGIPTQAALVAGAAVYGSGFCPFSLTVREVPAVAAWWPLLLYGVERTLREPTWRWRYPVLAVAVYCTIVGGQPEVTFVSLLATLVYGLGRLVGQRQHIWRAMWAVVPGTLAGFLLAAPMLVNFAAYAFTAYSGHQVGSMMGQLSLGFSSLATYVFPYLYGRVHTIPFGLIDGWSWLLSPGWFPAIGVFLALVSLSSVLRRPSWGPVFLWGILIITAAKIWGLPGVSMLARLPLLERTIFPRYSAFLLVYTLAALAAYGASTVIQWEASRWRLWLGAWCVLVGGLFYLGAQPAWAVVWHSLVNSSATLTLFVFGGMGLVWAIGGPLGLWWLATRHPSAPMRLYFLASLGILLQGVAYAPNGYASPTYAVLSVSCFALYLLTMWALGSIHLMQSRRVLLSVGGLCVALPALGTVMAKVDGLPRRYNPLTPAPYLEQLLRLSGDNLYRSYSFDAALQPNFAVPFAVTSLDCIEVLMPVSSVTFMQRCLDRGAFPTFFAGNLSALRDPHFSALGEFWHNKRYFDLVAVKYLITRETNPFPVSYDTETFAARREPVALIQPLEMTISCPTDLLSSVQVLLSTYIRQNPGTATLKILSDDGTLLRQQTIDTSSLLDNAFQEFHFSPLPNVKDQRLRLRLEFVPTQPDSMIAAWIYPDSPQLGFALRMIAGHPQLTLVYEDPVAQVRVWENSSAVPRVFLAPQGMVVPSWQEAIAHLPDIPNLTRQVWIEQGPEMTSLWPEAQEPGKLLAFALEPNAVRIQYEAHTPGILTLTDSYAEGWHVILNGQEAPVLRVNGTFRGVRLEQAGKYEVHFWYRPPHWSLSVGLAVVGGLLLGWVSIVPLFYQAFRATQTCS